MLMLMRLIMTKILMWNDNNVEEHDNDGDNHNDNGNDNDNEDDTYNDYGNNKANTNASEIMLMLKNNDHGNYDDT